MGQPDHRREAGQRDPRHRRGARAAVPSDDRDEMVIRPLRIEAGIAERIPARASARPSSILLEEAADRRRDAVRLAQTVRARALPRRRGSANSRTTARFAILAVCAVEWEMFLVVVEAHDRLVRQNVSRSRPDLRSAARGRDGLFRTVSMVRGQPTHRGRTPGAAPPAPHSSRRRRPKRAHLATARPQRGGAAAEIGTSKRLMPGLGRPNRNAGVVEMETSSRAVTAAGPRHRAGYTTAIPDAISQLEQLDRQR